MKIGLLLNNIGTPRSPSNEDVKTYLDEFLMDPGVIGLPFPLRWLLVKGLITPRRSPQSAAKYRAIWTERGSPLMVETADFADGVAKELGGDWMVRVGMRYGQPSVRSALQEMKAAGVDKVILAPLFPQFAEATTTSAVLEAKHQLKDLNWQPNFQVLPAFHESAEFLRPQAEVIRPFLTDRHHLLFSFHGLPESQIKKTEGCLASANCCERPQACALNCYRAQSLKTAKDLAQILGLPADRWSVSFQSRLGPSKWIGPATDEMLREFPQKGKKHLLVACPSFVADCLETLEEIAIEGKKHFLGAGGETYLQIPCLNSNHEWVKQFAGLLRSFNARTGAAESPYQNSESRG